MEVILQTLEEERWELMKPRKYSQQMIDKWLGLLLMVPIVLIIFGITGIPFVRAVYLSFTNKVVGLKEEFIGLENYRSLFTDKIYWKSLNNTVIYTVGCIVAKLLAGLLLALLLNQNLRGKAFFRTVLLIPWALPGMVAATTWRWMYDSTYGIINSMLLKAGMIELPIPWLSNPGITLLSTMIVNVWRGIPFFMFSLLGALQTLDKQVFEAAYVDGAGAFKQFIYITLPGISSVLGISALLSTIWTFNDFENVFLITGGGPVYSSSVISTYTYDLAFIQNSFGRALAVAVSVIPLMLIMIMISRKIINTDINQ